MCPKSVRDASWTSDTELLRPCGPQNEDRICKVLASQAFLIWLAVLGVRTLG